MKILAIDTSCDETSVAVVDDRLVLSNVISSQIRYHKKYGGVVPMLAGRLHQERIAAVTELALQRAGVVAEEIEAVAVTYGPGLAPALQVGITFAKEWAERSSLPLYGVNHMAGHLASCFAQVGRRVTEPIYPLLAILVSGGHSEFVLAEGFGRWQVVGQTLDDALGEAYDKVGKMLGLGYPGGRVVAQLARLGGAGRYSLPVPMLKSSDYNLSYSGLKNAVRLLIAKVKEEAGREYLEQQEVADICMAFEMVAQESLLRKLRLVLERYPEVRQLCLAGGVAANQRLRRSLRAVAKEHQVKLVVPANLKLCTDNAAMIGVAAALGIAAGQKSIDLNKIDRVPNLSLLDTRFTNEVISPKIGT